MARRLFFAFVLAASMLAMTITVALADGGGGGCCL